MTQQVPEGSGTATPAAAGLKVLVVEDEALIRLDLAEMLTEEGYVGAGGGRGGGAARGGGRAAGGGRGPGSRPSSWRAGSRPTW